MQIRAWLKFTATTLLLGRMLFFKQLVHLLNLKVSGTDKQNENTVALAKWAV